MSIRGRSLLILAASLLFAGVGRAEERKSEVIVEVKYVVLANEVAEQMKQQHLLANSNHGKDIVFLNKHQMRLFMAALQNDVRSNVMQAPKMTMFDGQSTTFQALDEQYITKGATIVPTDRGLAFSPRVEIVSLGVQLSLRPKISADRRFVRVDLDTQSTTLDENESSRFSIKVWNKSANGKVPTITEIIQPRVVKMGIKRTLTIPVGKSAVLPAGMRICQVRETIGPEYLKEIPLLRELFCTTESHPEVEHLLVLVTPYIVVPPEKEDKKAHKSDRAATICRCCCTDRTRTLILPPVRPGETVAGEEPDEATVFRALPSTARLPGVYEESRDNIQIVTERIADQLDPPYFFPLVGSAQLHHCRWKCTVYYMDTIVGSYPFSFRWTHPQKQVVFVDSDHLHLFAPKAAQEK
jgi:hypothetical protein